MKNELNISQRAIILVLSILLLAGTVLFSYACYAATECRTISAYFPQHKTDQVVEMRTAAQ